jgi:hypothetical protein
MEKQKRKRRKPQLLIGMIVAGMILLAMIFAAVEFAAAVRRYKCFFEMSSPQGVEVSIDLG